METHSIFKILSEDSDLSNHFDNRELEMLINFSNIKKFNEKLYFKPEKNI